MKVLLVHQGDYGWGGGQTQMNRLRWGLDRAGVDAKVLCRRKTQSDSLTIPEWPRLERYLGKVTLRLGFNDIHCLSSFSIKDIRPYRDADVIDFHCIHNGFFSYLALPALSRHKPAVLSLHDMWPFTGHCHNSLDCARWKTGCGRCPYPGTEPAIRRDVTAIEWKLKSWIYQRSHLTIVTPSRWLEASVRQSMLGHFPVHYIPHGINIETYRPLDPRQCRSLLGIPPDMKVIAFAVDDLSRRLKGGDLLQQALLKLPARLKRETMLLLMGRNGETLSRAVDVPALNLGFVASDALKRIYYSAADVFVLPTRAESFGLVVLESIACGTPVVSFAVGGVPDIVRAGVTGYLAEPEDSTGLSIGITRLLEDEALLSRMRLSSRKIAVTEYSLELQVQRYMELYRRVAQGDTEKQVA